MPARGWKAHLLRLVMGALLVMVVGLASGHWRVVVTTVLVLYACWLLLNTLRLHAWLNRSAGEPPESRGIWADIFDAIRRLIREQQTEQSRHQSVIEDFRSMTNAFPDATLVIDAGDTITWFNEAAQRLLGLRTPDDLGQPVTNLLRGPDFANWISVQDKVRSQLEIPSPKDANIHLGINAVHFGKNQRLLILRDISGIHNLERVRRDFVANVSHELRTPLTVLRGYLEGLEDMTPRERRAAVARMQEQGRQMQALLDDLLELSRLQSDSVTDDESDVDVPALLDQLSEQAHELSQGTHEIRFQVDPQLGLHGSAPDLESAFRNLVHNATQYTPSGGHITVTWRREGDAALFSVQDSGIGIPRRAIPRLTERFYRVGSDRSRHTGGTGLGLAIVKHVLNAHHASLRVDSELGAGSTFTCTFPARRVLRLRPVADRTGT